MEAGIDPGLPLLLPAVSAREQGFRLIQALQSATPYRDPSKFVVFEGIDGTGKSTQVDLLYRYLQEHHIQVIKIACPGGSQVGEKIREILFADGKTMARVTMDLLFTANHAENCKQIRYALDQGAWVIADRYTWSQIAFARVKGTPQYMLDLLKQIPMTKPDLIILLDGDPELCLQRAQRRCSRENAKPWGNLRDLYDVQNAYHYLASIERKSVTLDITSRLEDQLHSDVLTVLRNRFLLP